MRAIFLEANDFGFSNPSETIHLGKRKVADVIWAIRKFNQM
jgi:hypothetical protein